MAVRNLLISFIMAMTGGYLAKLLNIPLPWTLGALFASIVWNLCTKCYVTLRQGRRIGQFIIGISLGLYFTRDIVHLISQEWFLLSLGVFACLFVSFITIFINIRQHASFATIYFTYLPGGASEMVNMSRKFGADPTFVAIGHTVRIILLVFSVPLFATLWSDVSEGVDVVRVEHHFSILGIIAIGVCSIIGVFSWNKLKQANPWMIGALLGTILPTYFMELSMKVPMPLLAIAQVLLAMALADPITIQTIKQGLKYIKNMVLSSMMGIVALMIMAYVISASFHLNFLTIGLGMMPGGISEMGLTAKQLHLNVAIVTTMQTLRLLMVMVVAQPVFIWINRRNSQHQPPTA